MSFFVYSQAYQQQEVDRMINNHLRLLAGDMARSLIKRIKTETDARRAILDTDKFPKNMGVTVQRIADRTPTGRIPVKDLRKGMTVYECERGVNVKLIVQKDAEHINEGEKVGWLCLVEAEIKPGEAFELFVADGPAGSTYGPRIYGSPQYI